MSAAASTVELRPIATPIRGQLPWATAGKKTAAPEPAGPKAKRRRSFGGSLQAPPPAVTPEGVEESAEDDEEEAEELEADETRSPVEMALAIWADADPDAEETISELASAAGTSQAAPVMLLAVALSREGLAKQRALTLAFRLLLQKAQDPGRDTQATLQLLLGQRKVPHQFLVSAAAAVFGESLRSCSAGDLAESVVAARAKQSTLFAPRALTILEVATVRAAVADGAFSATTKTATAFLVSQLKELLGRAKPREAFLLTRLLQDLAGLPRHAVLRALSHAYAFPAGSAPQQDQLLAMAQMEDAVYSAFSQGGEAALAAALAATSTVSPQDLLQRSPAAVGVRVLPMQPQAASSIPEALERLGKVPLLAEWMMDGERVQLHVEEACADVKVFSQEQGWCQERGEEVAMALRGKLKLKSAILEAVLMKPTRKPAEEAACAQGAEVVVMLSDILLKDGAGLLQMPLRERLELLKAVVEEGPEVRLTPSMPLEPAAAALKAELDKALSAALLAPIAERVYCRATGLILKTLDGPGSEYRPGRALPCWQTVQKPTISGPEAEQRLFAALTEAEKEHLVESSAFAFCVVSARRTGTAEGRRDVLHVQKQFLDAGVSPVWYVDEASLEGYKALGLDAKVGGKLTPARNLALEDAAAAGKVCVQVSDDIMRWDYFDNVPKQKTLNEANAAVKRADQYHISPVAAARFMLAKMRGLRSNQKPKLGGVYPLRNLGQCFKSEEVAMKHFILGDFFVVDVGSSCRFDPTMTLKEDYDFTCSHLKAHSVVLRLNRMVIQAKHETNAGGACSVRDAAGQRERENIAILQRKWGTAIIKHPTRANQVILRWKK